MHCNTKWSPFASYQTVVQSHLRIGCAGGGGAAVLLLLWLVVPPLPLEVAAPLLADGSTADGGVATRAAVAAAALKNYDLPYTCKLRELHPYGF